jgi:hypothetical protein
VTPFIYSKYTKNWYYVSFPCLQFQNLIKCKAKEGEIMRYIISAIWSTIFMSIIGFIAAALTETQFNPIQAIRVGIVFGLLFAVIIPFIAAKSYKGKTKYSKML